MSANHCGVPFAGVDASGNSNLWVPNGTSSGYALTDADAGVALVVGDRYSAGVAVLGTHMAARFVAVSDSHGGTPVAQTRGPEHPRPHPTYPQA